MQATFLIYNIAIFFLFFKLLFEQTYKFFSKPQILVNQFTKNHKNVHSTIVATWMFSSKKPQMNGFYAREGKLFWRIF